jgi:glycosyltransferase involved in cell wall biosynthesis
MAKVSIIIPTYNVEQYLKECMDSVVNQTLKDIEIICVDDGSTDSSGKILDEYAQKDSRIKVIHKVNGGYGKAMNVGLDNATGEYIGIVEPDDYIEPDMFEILYNQAKESDVDFVKGNYYTYQTAIDKNELFVSFDKGDLYNNVIEPLKHIEIFVGDPSIWSALYNHKFLKEKEIRFLETAGASFQDTSFWIRVLFESKKALYIEKAHYHYRTDNAGSSVKDNSKIFCICDELEYLDNLYSKDNYKQEILNSLKLDKYVWNYKRLGIEGKTQFAQKYCEEIVPILKNKSYNRQLARPAIVEISKRNIREINHKHLYKLILHLREFLGLFIKKIFSIENSKDRQYKIVTVLWVEIKVKRDRHNGKS